MRLELHTCFSLFIFLSKFLSISFVFRPPPSLCLPFFLVCTVFSLWWGLLFLLVFCLPFIGPAVVRCRPNWWLGSSLVGVPCFISPSFLLVACWFWVSARSPEPTSWASLGNIVHLFCLSLAGCCLLLWCFFLCWYSLVSSYSVFFLS